MVRSLEIVRAEAMGLCFGVRDALDQMRSEHSPSTVTILGELVHNETVNAELRRRGYAQLGEDQRHQMPVTSRALITAHGASDRYRQSLQGAGKQIIDTTCPLVAKAHRAALGLAADGCFVLVLGRSDHVEVRGLVGDLEEGEFEVLTSSEEVRCYGRAQLGVIAQTTFRAQAAAALIESIRRANPEAELRVVDTICQPTKDRVDAVRQLAPTVDVMVVVGGKNSNNTGKLAELARQAGTTTYHVQGPDDLQADWFADCARVGLSAGTSTLDATIAAVEAAITSLVAPSVAG